MLWLAMLHGGNGLRTIINDYAEQAEHPLRAQDAALHRHGVVIIVLGTLVIFTFDPCIDPKLHADVCRTK